MADTETPNFDFTLIEVNASSGTWGGKTNVNWSLADTVVYAIKVTADAALSRAGGTMTGQLIGLAGSASTPSFTFAGDSNSGLYSLTDNQIGVTINGSAIGSFRATGWHGAVVGNVTGDTTGTHNGIVAGTTGSFSGLLTLNGGGLNTPRAAPTAADIGYLGMPVVAASSELALSDNGKCLTGTGFAIQTDANTAYPNGFVCKAVMTGGAGSVDVNIGVTLRWLNGSTLVTGLRNIVEGGVVDLVKTSANTWYITGTGIS